MNVRCVYVWTKLCLVFKTGWSSFDVNLHDSNSNDPMGGSWIGLVVPKSSPSSRFLLHEASEQAFVIVCVLAIQYG